MADDACANGEKRFVNVGTTLIAHAQTPELVQPGDRSLHYPTRDPQSAAVFGVAPCDLGVDSQFAQPRSMRLGVVGTVSLDEFGAMAGVARFARDQGNRLDQGDQSGDIVGIGTGQNHSERNALRIDREVVL